MINKTILGIIMGMVLIVGTIVTAGILTNVTVGIDKKVLDTTDKEGYNYEEMCDKDNCIMSITSKIGTDSNIVRSPEHSYIFKLPVGYKIEERDKKINELLTEEMNKKKSVEIPTVQITKGTLTFVEKKE